jgi:Pectate lyase superfamily protein
MRSRWLVCLVVLILPAWVWAGNTLGTGQDPAEREQVMGSLMAPYIYAGCLPAVPAGSLTLGAFACTGFVHDGSVTPPRLLPVKQAAKGVGPLSAGDGIYWLALHRDTTTAVASWTRQTGTHYLWRKSATKPTVASGLLVGKVTVASSVITAVEDWRVPSSYVRDGTYSVTDPLYGGVADDATDVGPALRAAIAAASAQRGAVVRIPQGRYLLASAVVIPEAGGLTLTGDGWTAPAAQLFTTTTQPFQGTWLHIQSAAFDPLMIRGTGTTVKDLAFDHDQPEPVASWAPTDYPYTIKIPIPATCCSPQTNTADVNLLNLFFFKATRGIEQSIAGGWAGAAGGRINITGLWGQFFTVGVDLKYVADPSRLTDVHMWPFWSSDDRVYAWQEAHLLAIVLYRCDSCMLHNIFLFSAYGGLNLLTNAQGATTGLQVTNLSTDRVRVSLFSDQDGSTAQLVNVRAAYWNFNLFPPATEPPGFATSSGIVLQGPNGNVDVVNYEGLYFGNSCARVLSSSILTLLNLRCTHYNIAASTIANGALQATGGGVIQVGGQQRFVDGNGAVNYVGTLGAPVNPNGVYFASTENVFFANIVSSNPTISFANNDFIQWLVATNQFKLGTDAGTYGTGGVKKYLCIQDGVLTVGATCP